jgi:hypothetical protein
MVHGRTGGLHTLFAVFLGLMVTAFVGVGVYTFYPSPERDFQDRIRAVDRQQQAIRGAKSENLLTADERARIQAINEQRDRMFDESNARREAWSERTSIVLVILATLLMAITLTAAQNLPVISNGLLMGGVFTMLYGVGWVIASATSATRFVVISIALGITLALGYLRFARGRTIGEGRAERSPPPTGDISELERRVSTLEERLDQAARALSPP